MSKIENVHATGLQIDGLGVMLRGPSGAGKSLLALALLDDAALRHEDARLVGDDRLDLRHEAGRLTMAVPAAIAGRIELRGRGIVNRPHMPASPVDLVVDLVAELDRMPAETAFTTTVGGQLLARCPVPQAGLTDMRHQILLIREALAELQSTKAQTRQKDT